MDLIPKSELSPLELMRRMSTNPAKIIDRPGGSLTVGAAADLVVLDPEMRWVYDPAKGYSKSQNSPWAGQEMHGRVIATIVDGKPVYDVENGVLA